ncbi:hypothetical protein AKJ52_02505 [candidate division MSBL1 archaeon SCGC-AAA382C18]|uniref:ParB-like N-terminal domain-containing protein n=1 Tax=candidate division MSBL1 archaeon SCGC-AAA382C18 TaxID=1698281 RepID=A0A133VI48_9EURY|nr:hypothetical protein AKJ52_02505 [candidate division MSBL1 archaeon SCGC-AAA382C18]
MKEIDVDKIDYDHRIRSDMDEDSDLLQDSIESIGGLIQLPVVYEKDNGRYSLVVGNRRVREFQNMDRDKIHAMVIEPIDDITASTMALIENLRRVDPSPGTISAACDDLARKLVDEEDVSLEEVVPEVKSRLGTTEKTAERYLALTSLADEVKEMVVEGEITKTEGKRVFGTTKEKDEQIEMAKLIRDGRLTPEQQKISPEVKEDEGEEFSVEALPEKTKERTQKSLSLWLPFDAYDRLESACEDLGIDSGALVRVAVEDWLTDHDY